MKKEVFINLNSYNLKNTLYTEHLKESRTTGKRTYAGIQEWVELFLIIIKAMSLWMAFSKENLKVRFHI